VTLAFQAIPSPLVFFASSCFAEFIFRGLVMNFVQGQKGDIGHLIVFAKLIDFNTDTIPLEKGT
jgi:hypothetical protein